MNTDGETLTGIRVSLGLSQRAMARAVHVSQTYLCLIETGKRPVPAGLLDRYQKVVLDMRRRGLITGASALLAAPAAMHEVLLDGFASALRSRASVTQWQDKAESYGTRYMQVGAGIVQRELASDLMTVHAQLESPEMWAVAARLLMIYGKTTQDPSVAIEWYGRAAECADRSGDMALRTWTRGRAGLALAYEGAELGTAARLAREALALSDRPSMGRLTAQWTEAFLGAARGQRQTALDYYDGARRTFDEIRSVDVISEYAMPAWRQATHASLLLARLGDPRAEEQGRAADHERPAELQRYRTHIELHRALWLARSGDLGEARRAARQAMDRLPKDRGSLSLQLLVREIDACENLRGDRALGRVRRHP